MFASIHATSAALGTRTDLAPETRTVGSTPVAIQRYANALLHPSNSATSGPESKSGSFSNARLIYLEPRCGVSYLQFHYAHCESKWKLIPYGFNMVQNDDVVFAGFIDTQTGLLGREVSTGRVFHPGGPISLTDRSTLHWEGGLYTERRYYKRPSLNMFDQFIRLWSARDQAILKFAEKWGPLRLARFCSLPCGASESFRAVPASERATSSGLITAAGGDEPLSAWRFFSRRAFTTLRIAVAVKGHSKLLLSNEDWGAMAINSGYPITREEWEQAKDSLFGMPNWPRSGVLPAILASELSAWMKNFPCTLWPALTNSAAGRVGRSDTKGLRIAVEIDYDGSLLAAIGLQLALVVNRADFYQCSECGRPYGANKWKHRTGRSNFCPECDAKGVALDRADRNRREKISGARRMYREGVSPAAIADRLRVRQITRGGCLRSPETIVKGWLRIT